METTVLEVLHITVLTAVVVRGALLCRHAKRAAPTAMFTFAMFALLISSLYWTAYSRLRPESRMPFAANEFEEAAAFLLLASVPAMNVTEKREKAVKETAFAVLFASANAVLWIAWSGEWVDDVLIGAALGFFLVGCMRSLRQTAAVSGKTADVLLAVLSVLTVAQASTFFLPAALKAVVDTACSAAQVLLAWLFLLAAAAAAFRKMLPARRCAVTFSGYCLATYCLYMSEGIWYDAVFAALAIFPLFLLSAVTEEVKEA